MSRQVLLIFLLLIPAAVASAKGPPSLDEVCDRHQSVVGAIATIRVRLKATYDPPEVFGDEEVDFWRDGKDFRVIFRSSLGRQIDCQGISGTLRSFTNFPSINGGMPTRSGSVGPIGDSIFGDPEEFCLLKVPGYNKSAYLPLVKALEEPHKIKSIKNIVEKGREYSVITLDHKNGKFEAWLSKDQNYLIEKMIIWEKEGGDAPIFETNVLEFKEISGIRFPTKVSTNIYSPADGKLRQVRLVAVEKIEINRPIIKSELDFQFPPGEVVLDQIRNKVWRTDENGEIGKEEAKNVDGLAVTIVKGSLHPVLPNASSGPTLEEPGSVIRWILPISVGLIAAGLLLFALKKFWAIKKLNKL